MSNENLAQSSAIEFLSGTLTEDLAAELHRLAELACLNLRIENDADAPMPWAVWGSDPTADEPEDIIGAGKTASDAIDQARALIAQWCDE